jgi:two-component system chemotaxis sensor kinase CheA
MTLDMARYLGLFVTEAGDHLARMGADLVRLEGAAREGADTAALVDGLFRHAHSVKGMSASMGLEGVAALAHRAEDLVDAFRRRGALPGPEAVDALLGAIDSLTALVERAATGESPEASPELLAQLTAAAARARSGGAGATATPTATATATAAAPQELAPELAAFVGEPLPRRRLAIDVEVAAACPVPSVRAFLVVKKLARLGAVASSSPSVQDLRAGQLPDRKLAVALDSGAALAEVERALGQVSDLARVAVREDEAPAPEREHAPPAAAEPAEASRTMRVKVELLDAFLDAVGELILDTARLREVARTAPDGLRPALDDGVDRLHGTVKDLHDKVMAARMTPLAAVTERLPRVARDLARKIGKQVEVEVRGQDIEIDRAILDELSDPLTHLLRNAVDHGLEAPQLRLLAGKPAVGRITVTARRERDRVLVEIADDGKGMDAGKLRAAAIARGVLTEAAARALDAREALLLACLPGVSTAAAVTEVSGRGVGMDAVKRAVEALGGTVDVESAPGQGTRWTLRLPLTVAVQPVLLVGVGGEVLALPIAKVHGAAEVRLGALETSQGTPVLPYDGKLVPVHELARLLGFRPAADDLVRSVVVADGEGGRVGLAVDALLGQQEAVLKPLSRPLDLVPGLSAVTVLGNGRPVFILDVGRLLAA